MSTQSSYLAAAVLQRVTSADRVCRRATHSLCEQSWALPPALPASAVAVPVAPPLGWLKVSFAAGRQAARPGAAPVSARPHELAAKRPPLLAAEHARGQPACSDGSAAAHAGRSEGRACPEPEYRAVRSRQTPVCSSARPAQLVKVQPVWLHQAPALQPQACLTSARRPPARLPPRERARSPGCRSFAASPPAHLNRRAAVPARRLRQAAAFPIEFCSAAVPRS